MTLYYTYYELTPSKAARQKSDADEQLKLLSLFKNPDDDLSGGRSKDNDRNRNNNKDKDNQNDTNNPNQTNEGGDNTRPLSDDEKAKLARDKAIEEAIKQAELDAERLAKKKAAILSEDEAAKHKREKDRAAILAKAKEDAKPKNNRLLKHDIYLPPLVETKGSNRNNGRL